MSWKMRKYTNGAEISKKIDEYFAECKEITAQNFAAGIKVIEAPQVAGLALKLQVHRNTIGNYLKDYTYADVQYAVERAYLEFERFLVNIGVSTSNPNVWRLLQSLRPDVYQEKQIVEHKETQAMPSVEILVDSDDPKSLEFDCGEEVKND